MTDPLPPLGTVFTETDTKPVADYDGKQNVLRKEPTKRGAAKTPKPPVKAPAMPNKGVVKDALMSLYGFAGMSLRMWSEPVSDVILTSAEDCAESLEELARTNESVRRVLLSVTKTSAWGAVIVAHVPIAMAVYAELSKPKVEITPDDVTEPVTV